jgi:hypothetical protein
MLVLTSLKTHLQHGLKTEHRVPRPAFSRPGITELSCLMTRSSPFRIRYILFNNVATSTLEFYYDKKFNDQSYISRDLGQTHTSMSTESG